MTRGIGLLLLCAGAGIGWAAQRYPVTGLVLRVDRDRRTFVASCTAIPGYMDAMVMPIPVREAKLLDKVTPGGMVDFTLVVTEADLPARIILPLAFLRAGLGCWYAFP
jgi:hypothetical protein